MSKTQPKMIPMPDGTWREVAPPDPGRATGAFVCGIVGTVIGLIPLFFIPAFVLGAIALPLGIAAWRSRPRKRMARVATFLGAAALVLGCVGFAIVNNAFDDLGDSIDCMDEADTAAEMEAC